MRTSTADPRDSTAICNGRYTHLSIRWWQHLFLGMFMGTIHLFRILSLDNKTSDILVFQYVPNPMLQ